MSKFIRNNQLNQYSDDIDNDVVYTRKSKMKKFKDIKEKIK